MKAWPPPYRMKTAVAAFSGLPWVGCALLSPDRRFPSECLWNYELGLIVTPFLMVFSSPISALSELSPSPVPPSLASRYPSRVAGRFYQVPTPRVQTWPSLPCALLARLREGQNVRPPQEVFSSVSWELVAC
jgi:hypothetical protein